MSTVEKLFVQIFERKNSIIQRVKQQTDFYTQHLASKALADGITPPPWLWNPNQSSDVQKVLNKEELISKILLPHRQPDVQFPSVHCSKYNKQVVAGDNAELLVGLSKDIYSYHTGDARDRETVATSGHDNNTRCTDNCVPEQDLSVNSPENETEARISNIYCAPDQSLARIQRSKSRQKALEFRNSGAKAKSHSIQKNVSLDSAPRNGQTLFASENVDKVSDLQELVEPSVIRHGTFGVGESNEADSTNQEEPLAHSTFESARLKGSGKTSSGVDSLKLGSFSGSIQRDDSAPVQDEEEFSKCVDCGSEFPEVTADSCVEARAEDCCGHKEKDTGMHDGRISQLSFDQQRFRQNEGPEVDISICSAKVDGGKLVQSTRQLDDANDSEEITKPSEGIVLERTRSASNDKVLPTVPCTSIVPCHRDKVSYSRCKQKSLEKNLLQRMSSGEAIIVCADPCNISHQLTNTEAVDASELISHDLVKALPVSSCSITDHARSELLVCETPDCLTFLSPKQLFIDDSEECNLDNRFSLNLENRMTQKPSSSRPERSTGANEFCRDSLKSTNEGNMQLVEQSFNTSEHPTLGTSYGNSVIVPPVQNPNIEAQTTMTHAKDCESSDLKDLVCWNCKEVCKSTPEVQTGKGQFGTGDKSKGTSACNASKRKHLVIDHNTGESDSISCGLIDFPLLNYQNHDLSISEQIKFGKKSQPWKMRSWPRTKRRKIEDHGSNSCSAGVNYGSQTDHSNRDLGKAGMDMENFVDHTSLMNERTNEEMRQKVATESNEEMKPLTEPLNREIVLCSGGLSEPLCSSSSDLLKVTVPIWSSLGKEAARVSQECLVKELEMHADLEKDNDEKDKVKDNSADTDSLTCTLHVAEDRQLSQYLERDLELNGIHQSLPELEGFTLDLQSENEELGVSGSQGNIQELVLPRTSLERVSILERICKSASQQAFSTEFSSSFKLHSLHMPYQSVPNGLLECMDLSRISASNEDSEEAVRSNHMDDVNCSPEGLGSDCMPYSGLQLGCTFSPYTSPVGKQWERTSLRSGSSGKTFSSNPELICFPIEEDPSVSEENENVDEESDKIQEETLSSINVSLEQEPFADMTEAHLNSSSLVAAADKFLSKGTGNSDTNDTRLNNTHRKVKRNVGLPARDKSLDKENDILSLGGNGNKKSKPSLNSRFSKANSSCKTSSRKERRKLSEKEPKRNNIISNVTSFIPLVQQKQAAAQCTGKREIKVKALEAAEAAKRLEERKANERKMRKEALRIEKARLEQENLRQLELEKKKKDEERKKRDADIAAKKRQREEEDKKEKERKKKRLEGARQQQREDGKLRIEKSKQLSVVGENDNRTKEANYESKKTQVLFKETRDNIASEANAKLRPNGSTNHMQAADILIEACRSSTDSSDHRKTVSAFNNSPKTDTLGAKKMQEKSYEISPYQCSDDDEEEEREIPNKKFIPSWTSKSSAALLLPLQQGIDPDTIFPPDSFCSSEKVLLPRKQQHKQLAT